MYKVRAFDDDPSSRLVVIYIPSRQKLVDHLDMLYKKGGCSHSAFFHNARNLLIIWPCCTKRGEGVFHNVRSLLNVGQCDFLLVQKSGRFCSVKKEIVTLNFKHRSSDSASARHFRH